MPKRSKKPPIPSKERVIELMNKVKMQLSVLDIDLGVGKDEGTPHGETLIDRINQRNPQVKLSGGRFDDMFLSRPERMVNARPEELVAVFEALLKLNPVVLPACDFLELCALMRMPINEIQHFVVYYTNEEWSEAIRAYQLFGQFGQDQPLIGRDAVVQQLYQLVMQYISDIADSDARHVVLSGPSGVGKSAIAMRLMTQIPPAVRNQVRFVYLDEHVMHMEDVYRAIGIAYELRPRGRETWQMLLADSMQIRRAVIVIDNILDTASLSAEAIMADLQRTLFGAHFVVTTQVAGLGSHFVGVHEINLRPLDEDARRVLFLRVREQMNTHELGAEQIDLLLANTHGYPMQVIAVANGMQLISPQAGEPPRTFVTGVPLEALRIMQLLMNMGHPVRIPMILMFGPLLAINDEVTLRNCIWLLERRQLLLRRPQGYLVHDAIRERLRAWMRADEYHAFLVAVCRHIAFFADPDEIEHHVAINQLQSYEIHAVYDVLLSAYAAREYALVASGIITWRFVWIQHGMTAEALALSNDCLPHIAPTDPNHAALLFAMGSFYGHRGIVDSTVRSLQLAMTNAERQSLSLIWAKAALEMGLHGLQAIGWRESERLLVQARTTFERIGRRQFVARCYDTLAYIYLIGGEIQQALQTNDLALHSYATSRPSYGLADAYSNRGIIYMALGDYEMARHELIKSESIFQNFNAPANLAAVHLRIAAVHALAHHADDARYYLRQAFRVIERIGGLNDVLYVIDIFAAVVLSEGNGMLARQVSDACSQARQNHGLPRGAALDAIVNRQLEYAGVWENDSVAPPLSTQIADLIDIVRRHLVGPQG
jgi:tetratricopeptide (TPR) repeat protein